jgi:hypothetical protein
VSTTERLRTRLLSEFEKKNRDGTYPMRKLLEDSGLKFDRSTLYRKLYDPKHSSLTVEEAEAIGKALGVRVTVAVTKRAA